MNLNVDLADLTPIALDLGLLSGLLLVFVVDLTLSPKQGRLLGWLSVGVLAGVLGGSFLVSTEGTAFFGAYQGDAWALFLKRVFLMGSLIATLGSIDHVALKYPGRQGEYYMLLLFSTLGMTLLSGARDLILLIVCFELMSLPLLVLSAFPKNEARDGDAIHAPESALKFYLVSAVSTALTLFGLSLIFGATASTRLAEIASSAPGPLLQLGGLLVFGGLAFKIGAVPFHMWVPDTYQGAPTPLVAFLSAAPKLGGFIALFAILGRALGKSLIASSDFIVAIALISLVLGNLLALIQKNVKRMLAYSGIAHIGIMLTAYVVSGESGARMLLFYAAAYVFTNLGAFLVVETLEQEEGHTNIDAFNGLSRRSPTLALAMLLFLLSLAGIPFVIGFWAKLYVFMAGWQAGFHTLVVVGAVASVVGLFYYLQIARAMYMMSAKNDRSVPSDLAMNLALGFCLAGVVVLGLWPAPLLDQATAAAQAYFGPLPSVAFKTP